MRRDMDDATLRGYLLGLLPEAEAEALEEAYFARPEVLERVRGVEDDLLDDYAAGRLAPGEKAAFETRYLASAPLRQRVVAARALHGAATARRRTSARVPAGPVKWTIPVGIAAGLLLVVLAVWTRPRPPQVATASPSAIAPSEMPPRPSGPPAATSVPTPTTPARTRATSRLVLALSPVLLRGQGRPNSLRIPAETDAVELGLEGDPALLPPTPSALHVVIKTVEGEEVWRGEARRVRNVGRPSLLAATRVPAAQLAAGDYLLTLSARGTADGTLYNYFVRVGR